MKIKRIVPLIILSAVLIAGCSPRRKALAEKDTFLLDAKRLETASDASLPECLRLRLCRTSAAFSGSQLVYRNGPYRYEKDPYNTFLSSPDDQITEIMSQWFRDANLFQCQPQARTVTIEPYLDVLCADFQDKQKPFVYVQLHLTATTIDESCSCPVTLLKKQYAAKVDLGPTPYASEIVEAMSDGLTQILTQIESDLAIR